MRRARALFQSDVVAEDAAKAEAPRPTAAIIDIPAPAAAVHIAACRASPL